MKTYQSVIHAFVGGLSGAGRERFKSEITPGWGVGGLGCGMVTNHI
jgi:hypothetical protein